MRYNFTNEARNKMSIGREVDAQLALPKTLVQNNDFLATAEKNERRNIQWEQKN